MQLFDLFISPIKNLFCLLSWYSVIYCVVYETKLGQKRSEILPFCPLVTLLTISRTLCQAPNIHGCHINEHNPNVLQASWNTFLIEITFLISLLTL